MSSQKTDLNEQRVDLLTRLINGEVKPEYAISHLKRFPFDSIPLVVLSGSHICSILNKFIDAEIDAEVVERWADAIEVRDDIEFDSANAASVKAIIEELANPVLFGGLDVDKARLLVGRLKLGMC